jgi:hypothetical protein
MPLIIKLRLGLPEEIQARVVEASAPKAPAMSVVSRI